MKYKNNNISSHFQKFYFIKLVKKNKNLILYIKIEKINDFKYFLMNFNFF